MTEQMELNYYKTAAMQSGPGRWPRPRWVPAKVLILTTVRSDVPGERHKLFCPPGEYEVECNPLGAVSVSVGNKMLGLMLNEFEVLEWRENPHYRAKR